MKKAGAVGVELGRGQENQINTAIFRLVILIPCNPMKNIFNNDNKK